MAQYTTNYKLHQWEPEDNFLRTDFNEDFAKIDTAIKGVADKAKTDTQTLTASTNTQFQALTAKAATAPVVLAKTTLAADNDTISMSLSGKNPGQYTILRLLFWGQAKNKTAFCYLRVNGNTNDFGYSSRPVGSSANNTGNGMRIGNCETKENGWTIYDISFLGFGQTMLSYIHSASRYSDGVSGSEACGAIHFCGFSSVSSLSITQGNQNDGPHPFAAGTKMILLGYKL